VRLWHEDARRGPRPAWDGDPLLPLPHPRLSRPALPGRHRRGRRPREHRQRRAAGHGHRHRASRAELRKLLETPEVAGSGRQRARLLTRLEQLKKQHAWGDLTDEEYLAKRDATRADLAELPDGDRIRTFDAYRARVLALPHAIEAASPARREELCRIVLDRVVVRDREVEAIDWTPAARPFFEKQRECPQGDSNP
jgi:hypothetical protein